MTDVKPVGYLSFDGKFFHARPHFVPGHNWRPLWDVEPQAVEITKFITTPPDWFPADEPTDGDALVVGLFWQNGKWEVFLVKQDAEGNWAERDGRLCTLDPDYWMECPPLPEAEE